MTLPRSAIKLRRHAQRLTSAVTATPLMCPSVTEYRLKATVLVAAREFSLFQGIRSTAKRQQQQPAAVPAAFRQLSSAAHVNRRSQPSWELLNELQKQVGHLAARNTKLEQKITELEQKIARNTELEHKIARNTELEQKITEVQQKMTGLEASNATLLDHLRIVVTHTLEPDIYLSSFRSWLKDNVATQLGADKAQHIMDGLESAANNNAEGLIYEDDQAPNEAADSVSPDDVCLAIHYSPSKVRRDLMAIFFKQFWGVTPEQYEALPEADKQLKRAQRMEAVDDETLQHLCDALRKELPDEEQDLDWNDEQGKRRQEEDVDLKRAA
ncbi:hypothetical protein FN846DRAFT_998451 [Sphaerosporella brunnea]|uniref:Uncharacterized protein n=1 Tax=Sphaerosporella brunnea TaxID=1250544 RepID=A0A5J5F5I9_9PEZI|nr:hypothetical protein FN846DRAFT_998451 [Sphaerosporella brunnea]